MFNDELVNEDTSNIIGRDPGPSSRVLTLPESSSFDGLPLWVKHIGGFGSIDVQSIDGSSLLELGPQDWALFACDGSEWIVLDRPANNEVEIEDPGNGGSIPVEHSGACTLIAADTNGTRTIANPKFAGQRIAFIKEGTEQLAVTFPSTLNGSDSVANFTSTTSSPSMLVVEAFRVSSQLRWRPTFVLTVVLD
ncbi:MAG: hypothetical protein AAF211_23830 [Myxococcota bacterium]